MWIYLLIIAIVIGAIIGYCNNGSKEDAAAGGCMAGMGCLQIGRASWRERVLRLV